MKMIKINFTDFWNGFEKTNNSIYNFLKNYYEIEISNEPDYLFFSSFGYNFLKYDCIRIFFTGENVRPDFNLCDYAIGFDYMEFGDRYIRWPLYRTLQYQDDYLRARDKHIIYRHKQASDYKFCNFIYSNGLAISDRDALFEALCAYKKVDSGGKHRNNIGGRIDDKLKFQEQYKFSIAYENSSTLGYTTEKIVQAFAAGTVPIYWGNPRIVEEFNSNSFINAHLYSSIDEIVQKVIEIDNDDELYNSMISAPAINPENEKKLSDKVLEDWFRNIFENELVSAKRRTGYMWEKRIANRHVLVERVCRNKILRRLLGVNLPDVNIHL